MKDPGQPAATGVSLPGIAALTYRQQKRLSSDYGRIVTEILIPMDQTSRFVAALARGETPNQRLPYYAKVTDLRQQGQNPAVSTQ